MAPAPPAAPAAASALAPLLPLAVLAPVSAPAAENECRRTRDTWSRGSEEDFNMKGEERRGEEREKQAVEEQERRSQWEKKQENGRIEVGFTGHLSELLSLCLLLPNIVIPHE